MIKFRSAEWIVPGRSLHVVSGWDDGFFHHIVDLAGGKIIDLGENFGNMSFVTGVDTAGGRLLKAGAGGMIQIYDASGNLQNSFNLAHTGSCRQYLKEITQTEMSGGGGEATFYIKLTKPEPGKMYAAVISHPYLAGNINLPENTIIRFVIEETGEVLNVSPIH